MLHGAKSVFVIDGLGEGVDFGAADFTGTPLFQTNFPFFFTQVYFLLAKVFCDFSFLQLEPGTIFCAELAESGVKEMVTDRNSKIAIACFEVIAAPGFHIGRL